ncbi:MAG: hypothetical protein S4CHLAM7_13020 [Chlamydiae bacterium]|nr:hypothetical protein [Chlamydiota bacterium]
MAQKPIREYSAKKILAKHWNTYFPNFKYPFSSALVHSGDDLVEQSKEKNWLKKTGLVVKPDMLFGKRGLNRLVLLKNKSAGDIDLKLAKEWINANSQKETTLICGTKGQLNTFIVEPFCNLKKAPEYYVAFSVENDCDLLYMSAFGGVEVEENWDSVKELRIAPQSTDTELNELIYNNTPKEIENKKQFADLVFCFYQFFKNLHFSYLEFNPFILDGNTVHILDVVARIDDTARFLMNQAWGDLEFPSAFGEKEPTAIEKEIQTMDENSGASLKLSLLNSEGIVWTLVAGGGASVVFADSIANLWGASEIANYGEYSGNPSKEETYCYTMGVLKLMTAQKDPKGRGKVLIIGGSIANFTDVAKTFDGIIQAFREMHVQMKEVETRIFVRRGGPNYEIGLKNIETAASQLGLPIEVHGPDTHLTDIVRKALITQKEGVLV